jgi:hypothetical protein
VVELGTEEGDDRRVAEFCALLPTMRRAAGEEGWAGLLDTVEEKLRLRSAPPAEVLDELWEYLGLRGVTRRGASINVAIDGQDPLPPPQGTYRCPAPEAGRRCARHEGREPSGPVPECALYALPMRFVT